MPKRKIIKTHTVSHMWNEYSRKLLLDNPTYWSRVRIGFGRPVLDRYYIYVTINQKVIEVINYERFRKIIEQYFERAKEAIIRGEAVNIRKCGKLLAVRNERFFTRKKNKRPVNWKKTNEKRTWNEAEQKWNYPKIYFHTQDDWCRIAWAKSVAVRGVTLYSFKPTNSSSTTSKQPTLGFKQQFAQALESNPLLKYNYLYRSVQSYTEKRKVV